MVNDVEGLVVILDYFHLDLDVFVGLRSNNKQFKCLIFFLIIANEFWIFSRCFNYFFFILHIIVISLIHAGIVLDRITSY